MKLTIKNFARIKEAEINIDGITIIAGENNTGKTTIGKVLFSCFNSLNNIEEAILLDKKKAINREFFELFKILLNEYVIHNEDELTLGKIQNITNILYYNYINTKKNIYDILIDKLKEYVDIKDETIINHIKKTAKRIEEYINISYNKLAYKKIEEYFNDIFNNQINSRIEKDTIAEINIPKQLYFVKNKFIFLFLYLGLCPRP
ncbi:AAA family ATPase [Brachyspira pulli]|uniref:AAA family ATPase n=1 Tax=Brachyspira pulli TaxID=310721 RepID=UPI00300516CA